VGEASIRESEASLLMAKTNLDYTVIRSPDDGVIIERRVAVGQTVTMVPGFNAPGLFLIVKDSRQVQVWASVHEADIAYIHPGAPVQFTVNACLDESFEGQVAQVRQSPTKQGDAVTYTVVVVAGNVGKLLPDMTANLQFVVDRRPNVLLISNDVLRSLPQTRKADQIQTTAPPDVLGQPADADAKAETEVSLARRAIRLWNERKANRRLWVKDGGLVRPVEVQLGASNGLMTEIMGNNVTEGMEVVWGEACMTQGR
jgi:HlyD family secretion protein